MTGPMLMVFGILAGAIVLFASGRPRADIVAILVVLALMLSRVLTPHEALAGFGDPVVILITAIFVVGEALVNTGVAHRLGEAVMKLGGGNETRLIVLLMTLAGVIGAFMSSSAIVAMFIPVVLAVARKTGMNSKRMLMPLSVAALVSGMMTLIASSPNMIIEGMLRERGLAQLNFFSWTPFGLAVLAAAIAFTLMARGLLSKQLASNDAGTTSPSASDLVGSYSLTDRWHRLRVPAGSPLIDRSVAQMQHVYDDLSIVLVGFEKHLRNKTRFLAAVPESIWRSELIPNSAAALLSALAMVAGGCVRLDAIYRIISWKTVVLIAGTLPLATALTKTGATDLMAKELVAALGPLGPIAMLAVVFVVTAMVGLFVSNSATAVLIGPIAIDAAQTLHVSPYAFAMTVSIACCAAYVTPVSSPVNMLVMEPGGYVFSDYVKVGLPLLLLTMLVTVALVALIYPL